MLRISAELQQSCASCLSSCRVAFVGTGTPYALVFAFVAYHYQGHDMTSCCWLVVMGSERFASPIMGIFCGGLNAYCMRIWPLFLRTSGSSGVLKALLLERNRQLSCNPKKKKKKKRAVRGAKLIGVTAPTSNAVFILLHRAALVQ